MTSELFQVFRRAGMALQIDLIGEFQQRPCGFIHRRLSIILLDGLGQFPVSQFGTEKLPVSFDSVVTLITG